jgi:vacuolar-type H+-ATPase subunit E/Vma4
MSDAIQALLEKIHREGVQAAEERASVIEEKARTEAQQIVMQAQEQARQMIRAAEEDIRREQERSRASLAHAGRDMILLLRSQIERMLAALAQSAAAAAFEPAQAARVIADLITRTVSAADGAEVFLPEKDIEQTRVALLSMLAKEVRKGIVVKSDKDMSAGFAISFDAGKSRFDFSDRALADYLGRLVNPELARLVSQAVDSTT